MKTFSQVVLSRIVGSTFTLTCDLTYTYFASILFCERKFHSRNGRENYTTVEINPNSGVNRIKNEIAFIYMYVVI